MQLIQAGAMGSPALSRQSPGNDVRQLPSALVNKLLHVNNHSEVVILTTAFHSIDLRCSVTAAWTTCCLENEQARQTEKLEV